MLTDEEQRKLELLLDIPLKVSVVLGRTRRPIKEVLGLTPGAIVELSSLVDEPVEVLVNGTLVARGEVVVVNENFGVRITSIISPAERVEQLGPKH
ncbi:MAG TPA: flagellar motor switch protein FliN [Desulfotomaculum sp.]|nr:flagellar motor switch protein FliN [Desulfotomaculum sp.]